MQRRRVILAGLVAGVAFAIVSVGISILVNKSTRPLGPGVTLTTLDADSIEYQVVTVDLAHADVSLVWKRGDDGTQLARLSAAVDFLRQSGRRAVFATNAGIFDPSRAPVGLHVENGQTLVQLNQRDGEGNFYLKPNGVFQIAAGRASVVMTDEAAVSSTMPTLATQSGPILLRAGQVNSAFQPNSPNRRTRSGVGVDSTGRVVFALSKQPTTFHAMAVLFRDRLACPDALYLDGDISRFHVPDDATTAQAERETPGNFAGILVVTVK